MNPSPRLSLCMIVRDEELFLRPCLESVQGIADEIVAVDTGSRDSTVAIAEQFGARVLHYTWNDDFSAARNQALAASTGQWVLTLDADERLDPRSAMRIREAVQEGGWDIGLLPFVNMSGDRPCGREWLSCRVFRRTPHMRYLGRIHEQMVQQIPQVRTRVIESTVYHYGYQVSVFARKQKQARNARLIEQALCESASQGPLMRSNYLYHYANLASNQELLRRYDAFAAYVREQWPQGPPQAPWITAGLVEYARLLNDVGRYRESGALAGELLDRYGETPLLHYLRARARAASADRRGAEEELQKALQPNPPVSDEHRQYAHDVGLARGRAHFLLGLIREQQGGLQEAVAHYQAAVAEEPEQDILRARLACALARLGRYPEALQVLEASPALLSRSEPGIDCLGFVLALLTRSVARLAIWGDKVRRIAPQDAAARAILQRVEQLGPHWAFRMEDFPEIARGISLAEEPGAFEMPQTSRQGASPRAGT